jgi:hypothetical protein
MAEYNLAVGQHKSQEETPKARKEKSRKPYISECKKAWNRPYMAYYKEKYLEVGANLSGPEKAKLINKMWLELTHEQKAAYGKPRQAMTTAATPDDLLVTLK